MLRAGWVGFALWAAPAWAADFTSVSVPEFAGHVTASLMFPDCNTGGSPAAGLPGFVAALFALRRRRSG